MEKDKIIEILNDWNFWRKKQDIGIVRKTHISDMKRFVQTGQIISIIGVRRAGKSTLMLQYIDGLIRMGIKPENTMYVNFEDRRFYNLSLKLLNDIYETYLEYLEPEGERYIFLDEIQNIPQWERFVRTLHERKEAFLFISGSSSKLLSSELATVLTGRTLTIDVFPLSFKEFLIFKNIKINNKLDLIDKRHKIKNALREFIKFGGFPLTVLKDEKEQILAEYFDNIIEKDVIQRYHIRKIEKLKTLAKYYLTNISAPISFNKIKNFLSMPVDTVERFSYYLESAGMIFFLRKFSFTLKEQERARRKVYCIDAGLRNAVSFKFRENLGKLAENIVAVELKRRNKEIYYWKDRMQREVDFIVKDGLNITQLLQVCWNIEDPQTKEREVRALLKAMDEFNIKEGLIITEDYSGKERIDNKIIRYIPLWRWLLDNAVGENFGAKNF